MFVLSGFNNESKSQTKSRKFEKAKGVMSVGRWWLNKKKPPKVNHKGGITEYLESLQKQKNDVDIMITIFELFESQSTPHNRKQ